MSRNALLHSAGKDEVRGVNRVFYDLTSKPPGTILLRKKFLLNINAALPLHIKGIWKDRCFSAYLRSFTHKPIGTSRIRSEDSCSKRICFAFVTSFIFHSRDYPVFTDYPDFCYQNAIRGDAITSPSPTQAPCSLFSSLLRISSTAFHIWIQGHKIASHINSMTAAVTAITAPTMIAVP